MRRTVVHEIHALLLPPHHDACASRRVPPRMLGLPNHCQSVFSNHRRNRGDLGCSRTKAANNGRAVLTRAPYCIEFHTNVYRKEICCYCLCELCFIMCCRDAFHVFSTWLTNQLKRPVGAKITVLLFDQYKSIAVEIFVRYFLKASLKTSKKREMLPLLVLTSARPSNTGMCGRLHASMALERQLSLHYVSV